MTRLAGAFLALIFPVLIQAQASQSAGDMHDFVTARMAAKAGDYSKALEMMDDLIDRHPDDAVLRFERAQVLLETARVNKATEDLIRATKLDPDFYDAQRLLGRLLIDTSGGQAKKVDEALSHLKQAYRIRPNDVGTGLAIVQIHLGAGRLDDAELVLKELSDIAPDSRTVNFQLSQLLTRNGKADEAKEYLEKVVAAEPTFAPAVFQLLDIYQTEQEWGLSAKALEPLAAADPANLDVQRRLGYFYLRSGRSEEAIRSFESLIKVDPGDERTLYMLAEALSDDGKYQKANVLYRRLLQNRPNDAELLISLGANQLSQSRFDDARVTFKVLAGLDDVSDQVHNIANTQLAGIDHQMKRYDEALEAAVAVAGISEAPNYQATSIALDIYRRREAWDDALELIDSSLERFPDDEIFKIRRLEYTVRADRTAEAEAWREELESQGRRGALAAVQAYVQAEVYAPAIPMLVSLRKENPDDINVLFQLGAAYERAGQTDKSEEVFLDLLSKEPDHASSLNYLGYMWADQGVNLEKAEKMLVEAVSQQPRNGAFVDSLGWVYYRLGKYDLARKHLADAAALLPQDPTVRLHLGDVYLALGLDQEALEEFRVALANEPTPADESTLRDRVGELEEKLGRK